MTTKPTALITGAGARLGRAFAEHLAGQGYHLALHYNNNQQGVQQLIDRFGNDTRVSMHQADFSDADTAVHIIDEARQIHGTLDLLINNASTFPTQEFSDCNSSCMSHTFAVNCFTPLLLCQAFADQHTKGHIINILDARIKHKHPQRFIYSMSKQSLYQATLHCAQLLAPAIRVNAICPGPVFAPIDGNQRIFQQAIASVPMQRRVLLADLLSGIDYLENNTSITGEVLCIDSGDHLH